MAQETYLGNAQAHLALLRAEYLRAWVLVVFVLGYGALVAALGLGPIRAVGVVFGAFGVLLLVVLLASRRRYHPETLPNGLVRPRRRGLNSDRGSWLLVAGSAVLVVAALAVVVGTGGADLALLGALVLVPVWLVVLVSALIGIRTRARGPELLAQFLQERPGVAAQVEQLRAHWPADARIPFS
ncbi:hypothetical protein [Propioniciclava soli]|uniref:Sensor histidine kinase n=1 Tax=Propioniciclava soli TaxID=2775081 RepID=A0ABZ3C880_9ACTN|nr:hypothetical protein [Propioniciclava soli]